MEEFIGFTFNNIHSSSLGIQRMSKGGLISQPFLPTIQDKAEEGIKTDGSVYLGTKLRTLVFQIDFVYGPIDEFTFQKIKSFCNSKTLGPLILDETPHKIYTAKISGSALSSYNVYGDDEEKRYIGTGQLTFTSYSPYATGKYHYIEELVNTTPSWESGRIINVEQPYSAKLIATEEDIVAVSQIIGELKIFELTRQPDHFIGELKVDKNSYWVDADLEQELLDILTMYELPFERECGIQKEGDNIFFVIDNVGDTEITVSPTLIGRGILKFYIDEKLCCSVENWDTDPVKMDGNLNFFLNKATNKLSTKCKMLEGDFLKIPPGRHRISLKTGNLHSWNSTLIGSVDFRYQYA